MSFGGWADVVGRTRTAFCCAVLSTWWSWCGHVVRGGPFALVVCRCRVCAALVQVLLFASLRSSLLRAVCSQVYCSPACIRRVSVCLPHHVSPADVCLWTGGCAELSHLLRCHQHRHFFGAFLLPTRPPRRCCFGQHCGCGIHRVLLLVCPREDACAVPPMTRGRRGDRWCTHPPDPSPLKVLEAALIVCLGRDEAAVYGVTWNVAVCGARL